MASYNKNTVRRILQLIRADTYTQREICEIVGLDEATFSKWKRKHPDFAEDIEKAKDQCMESMVVEAKKSLRKKITGYTVTETKIISELPKKTEKAEKTKDGKPKAKVKEITTTEKHIQPDTAAIIFTLTNGDPAHWKNKINNEVTGKDGRDLFENLTDEELEQKIKDLERKSE